MGTKLIIYTLLFDIFLALMVGSYSGISPPSIPSTPTYQSALNLASSITWTVGWGSLTIIPSFTLIPPFSIMGTTFPGLTIPAVTIPGVTLFSINFGFLAPLFYIFMWTIWIFITIADVLGYLLAIFTGSMSLLASIPVVGLFLSAFVLIINFILVWEVIKLIRGYGP